MLAGLAMQNICPWLSPHLTSYTQHITRLRSYPIPLGLPEHKPPAGSPVQTVAVERPKAQSQKHQKNSNLIYTWAVQTQLHLALARFYAASHRLVYQKVALSQPNQTLK